jgi:hypothetical protein
LEARETEGLINSTRFAASAGEVLGVDIGDPTSVEINVNFLGRFKSHNITSWYNALRIGRQCQGHGDETGNQLD